ncbi:polysaccharide deacetylase family protein [Jeongeupia sp. USM3]|uniref:polysaccharide deacetylase family protein n=1 Tax=Jeongeupia sp. USM3 TaxID=1906741 RepID=UPI0009F52946|nr:polysaccharide deacetylase family protein [Jeongeupia sp. USM3]
MNFRAWVVTLMMLCTGMAGAAGKTQKIRTPYLEGWEQIPLAVMERQAAAFPGTYWIEGPGTRKQIALTFDDGPSANTPELLKVLKKHGVHATFFWLGAQVEQHPALAREVAAQGHTIANHSYNHPYSSKLIPAVFWRDQVEKTQQIMQQTLGFAPTLFRPPYGDISDAEVRWLQERDMKVISWSIDTRDWWVAWKKGDPVEIEKMVTDYLHPEAIVLMHDGGGARDRTIAAVDAMIPKLKAQGYTLVTVDALLGVPGKQVLKASAVAAN